MKKFKKLRLKVSNKLFLICIILLFNISCELFSVREYEYSGIKLGMSNVELKKIPNTSENNNIFFGISSQYPGFTGIYDFKDKNTWGTIVLQFNKVTEINISKFYQTNNIDSIKNSLEDLYGKSSASCKLNKDETLILLWGEVRDLSEKHYFSKGKHIRARISNTSLSLSIQNGYQEWKENSLSMTIRL